VWSIIHRHHGELLVGSAEAVANYANALTYGRKYAILGIKGEPRSRQIKVRGDKGRVRWYPTWCFDLSGADVPRLETITICDDLAATAAIEVDITLSDGQRRWCCFATPETLAQFGD
jgi:hypothetical protein